MKKIEQSENGRSMVEMIALLSVVAVLTVLGIVAYFKGMEKYKANKILDQTYNIYNNLQDLYGKVNSYAGLKASTDEESTAKAIAFELFPENMVHMVDGKAVVNHAGGGRVVIGVKDGHPTITFYDLTREQAISLVTTDFNAENIELNAETSDESGADKTE